MYIYSYCTIKLTSSLDTGGDFSLFGPPGTTVGGTVGDTTWVGPPSTSFPPPPPPPTVSLALACSEGERVERDDSRASISWRWSLSFLVSDFSRSNLTW